MDCCVLPPGSNLCHCAAPGCHRTFRGQRGFDYHQLRAGGQVICRDPASMTDSEGRSAFARRQTAAGRAVWSRQVYRDTRPPQWRQSQPREALAG